MSIVAIIPARGGSKRIPRKNIRPFCGKPILAYPIEAARRAGVFDAILVSTDDEEIAAAGQAAGAEAPFRRPAELANDSTPTVPVIGHAIRWFEQHRGPVTFACCIYATTPFLQPEHLREGLRRLQDQPDAEFVVSVTSYAFPIFRSLKLTPEGTVALLWPEHEITRSQDLPPVWHDAGQFYWGRKEAFLSRQGVFGGRVYPAIIPRRLAQDIDTPEDWEMAEAMFRTLNASPAIGPGSKSHG